MLRYVWDSPDIVSSFAANLIPHCRTRGFGHNIRALGVVDERNRLIAGIVYHNYDPGDEENDAIIEISGAAITPRWLSRRTLQMMHAYPFTICGCQMVVQRIPADNERLFGILARLSYMLITVPRLFGRKRDGVLALLTVEDWRGNRYFHNRPSGPLREAA
jgi:RimJ/RimL family protein N-acetyltransferase